MRIKITFAVYNNGRVDFNYQHQIQSIIYKFLASSNPDYAAWLHEEGYIYRRDQRFKFFVYSGIIFHGPILIKSSSSSNRSNSSSRLNGLNQFNERDSLPGFCFHASSVSPFTFSFQIASPVNKFLQHLIDGIFKEGQEISLGQQRVIVYRVESLTDPLERTSLNHSSSSIGLNGLSLCPLESPIFVKKPMPLDQKDKYLFPGDEEYEELLNQNLQHKYETLYGTPYEGERLKFDFNQLERIEQSKQLKPKLIKSFKVYKDGKVADEIKGTLQPFTVSGSKELIKIGMECGFGQNNSMGCGYVEAVQAV